MGNEKKGFLKKLVQPARTPVDPISGRPYGVPAPVAEPDPGLFVSTTGGYAVGAGVDGLVTLETPAVRAERIAEEAAKLIAAAQGLQ